MLKDYKEISPKDFETAYRSAWSIENMAAHEAEDRSVEYIGSARERHRPELIRDYYRDSTGAYWYGNRAEINGQLVSMEFYIFGKRIKKRANERVRL